MSNVVGSSLEVVSKVLTLLDKRSGRHFSSKLLKYKDQLNVELQKPYNMQNDALIEHLSDKIGLIIEYAEAELERFENGKA